MEPSNHFERLKSIFSELEDPRIDRTKFYPLLEIILLTISAVISGCQTWDEIADFGEAKLGWLRQYLPFENGVPSHDTINRVISRIDYRSFEESFICWTNTLLQLPEGAIISIDGKTLRGSIDRHHSKSAIHLVNAWCNDVELILGQYQTEDKSNEITAIPQLLDLLDIEGSIITIDAMGCQKDIAAKIIDYKADYILALKANQGELFEEVQKLFEFLPAATQDQVDKDHGRIESRRCQVITDLSWMLETPQWKGLKSVVQVQATRQTIVTGSYSSQTRYYLSSLDRDPDFFNRAIRDHWGIENRLHWSMDVVFDEDQSRKRNHNAAQNFAIIRKIAQNLLKMETSKNISLNRKMRLAAMTDSYRQKILKI